MVAERRYYDYDLYTGNAAKKKKAEYEPKVKVIKKPKVSERKMAKTQSSAAKATTILWVLSMFAILMIVIYRFSVINEKNLMVQSLKKDLLSAQSVVASSQIDLEQKTNLNDIEAYAKQKLGMQKPDKNQIIYIDNSSSNAIETNQSTTNTNILDKALTAIKEFINKIF